MKKLKKKQLATKHDFEYPSTVLPFLYKGCNLFFSEQEKEEERLMSY
jgi:hypothetical protein